MRIFALLPPRTSYTSGFSYACQRCLYYICEACYSQKVETELAPAIARLEANLAAVAQRYNCPRDPTHRVSAYDRTVDDCSRCGRLRENEGGVHCASGCSGTDVCAHCLIAEAEKAVRSSDDRQRFVGMRCTKHDKQVVTARLSGLKLFFDFNCLLCRNSKHIENGQLEDLAEDDEDPNPPPVCEGDEVVVCPNPRCRLALCMECARWLENQRRLASSAGVLSETLPGYTLDLMIEHTRKPFRCNVCDEYHEPPSRPDRLLVYLQDPRACFSLCLGCAGSNSLGDKGVVAEMKRHAGGHMFGKDTDDDRQEFDNYRKWKRFALKQQEIYEKNLPTRSIMATPELNLSPEAFHELELKVHMCDDMPVPIIFEVEVSSADSNSLATIITELIRCSRWPLHTTLKLIEHAKEQAATVPRTSELWKAQASALEEYSVTMLDKLGSHELIEMLVMCPRPRLCAPPKPLLTLAIDADNHPFLSHRSVQMSVLRKWLSPIRLDMDTSPEMFMASRVLFTFISWMILFANWVSCGALGGHLKTKQERQSHPILAHITRPDETHVAKEDFFMFSPKTSFQMYSLSYLLFAVLVSYTSLVSCREEFTWNEILIAIWVAALIRVEVYQLSSIFLDYFRSFWNVFDILLLLAYVAALGVKLAIKSTPNGSYKERVLMETHECVLSVAVFMTYMHGLYVCRPNAHLGPILISFGNMIGNVLIWISIAITVIVAITLALLKLYIGVGVVAALGSNSSSGSSAVSVGSSAAAVGSSVTESSSDVPAVGTAVGANFATVFTSLVWGMTNMPPLDGSSYEDVNEELLTPGRRVFSQIIVTIFMILVTIVLINLLVAVMNTTYSKVTNAGTEEHKVSFVSVVEEFAVTPPLPPPLNLAMLVVAVLLKATYTVAARLARLCGDTRCTCCTPKFLQPRDKLSPWAPMPVLNGVRMHTTHYMHLKRLDMAMTAEASVEGRLRSWLNAPKEEPPAQVSCDLDELSGIASRLAGNAPPTEETQ
eukprot:m51a1_g1373 hypothetical protein (1000) ;mRNA; f:428843-432361